MKIIMIKSVGLLVMGWIWMSAALAIDPTQNSHTFEHTKVELIALLYEGDGIRRRIENIPTYLDQLLVSERAQFNQLMFGQINRQLAKVVNKHKMHRHAQAWLEQQLTMVDIKAILRWLESPLGRALTKVENDESDNHRSQGDQNQAAKIVPPLPNPQRTAMMQHFDRATHTSHTAARTIFYLMQTVFVATELQQPTMTGDVLQSKLKQQTKALDELQLTMHRQTEQQFLQTYQTVTDASMQQYLSFAESQIGNKYYRVVSEALVQAVRLPLQNMLQEF